MTNYVTECTGVLICRLTAFYQTDLHKHATDDKWKKPAKCKSGSCLEGSVSWVTGDIILFLYVSHNFKK